MFAQVVNFPQVPMPPGLSAGQIGLHQYLISSADVINSQIVSVAKTNLIQAITNGNLSTLLPGDGSPMSWITLHFDYTSEANYEYIGLITDDAGEEYININMHDNQLYMEINTATGFYRLMPLNDDVQVFLNYQDNYGDQTCVDLSDPGDGTRIEPDCNIRVPACDIRMLFIITASVASRYNGANFLPVAVTLVDQANSSFKRSGVVHRITLVGMEISNDVGGDGDVLYELARMNIYSILLSGQLKTLREQYQADVLFGVINDICGPGETYAAASTPATNGPPSNYAGCCAVAKVAQVLNADFTGIHEIGHWLNGRHTDDPTAPPGRGYIFTVPNVYTRGTLMDNTKNMKRINYYSTPKLKHLGVPIGDADHNNVCNMNAYGCTVAELKPSSTCSYTSTSDFDNDCTPTTVTIETKPTRNSPTNCHVPGVTEYEFFYSTNGVNYTLICPRSTSNICTFNVPIFNVLFVKTKIYHQGNVFINSKTLRKQCIAGVTSRAKESMEWDVFHSPSEDQIEIHWYQSSNQISAGSPVFRIYNVQGVVIKEITGKSEYDIFVPSRSLANGIYYVQMTYDHQTEIKSFFKAN